MAKIKFSGATIPYQLRPFKAIERNLFIELLRSLESSPDISLIDYRYVGFGAPFLEDFKQLHLALRISDMDCIESNDFAQTRQLFNNPYNFIRLIPTTSTKYINDYFHSDRNQIIWLDYSSPKELEQQLLDIEHLGSKLMSLDIVKFTFNSEINSYITSHGIKNKFGQFIYNTELKTISKSIRSNEGLNSYLPEFNISQIKNFDQLIRAMCLRALRRGIAKANKDLDFIHLSSFKYADGQEMTTVTGMICKKSEMERIISETKIKTWPFYSSEDKSEFTKAIEISVPVMTAGERIAIDKKINIDHTDKSFAEELDFRFGKDMEEHKILVDGYCKFYRYLPYYGKIIY